MRRLALFAWLLPALPLITGCGGGSSGYGGNVPITTTSLPASTDFACGEAGFRDQALLLVNQRRAAGANCGSNGNFPAAAPVSWSDALTQASYGHSKDMADRNYFDHVSPEGATLSMRIDATGYTWSAIGENIAAGQADAAAAIAVWMSSAGHCKNIMTARYAHIGMACAHNGASRYGRYFTLDLATPR